MVIRSIHTWCCPSYFPQTVTASKAGVCNCVFFSRFPRLYVCLLFLGFCASAQNITNNVDQCITDAKRLLAQSEEFTGQFPLFGAHGADFLQCFAQLNSTFDAQYHGSDTCGTTSNGSPVSLRKATGIPYKLCVEVCGSGQEPFNWSQFAQRFSAWLLPWLALISQLPFGASLRIDNLVSVFLTVGSPTLAAYSLAITALNGQWVAQRFSNSEYSNVAEVVGILRGLQQAPLRVMDGDRGLLASLVVLPENDRWFAEMAQWIKFGHTWSISAATSIGWVLVAYVLTVAQSFQEFNEPEEMGRRIESNGQAVGSIWLWLVPIVAGWLQIAPKIESARLADAMNRANALAQVATDHAGVVHNANALSRTDRAFWLATRGQDCGHPDELATAPIFNYARFLPWVQAVDQVANAYDNASAKMSRNIPVNRDQEWNETSTGANRYGTLRQVVVYCRPVNKNGSDLQLEEDSLGNSPPSSSFWGPGVLERCFVASAMALTLQWATTGSAVVMLWFTPTTGLSCRSAAYLAYGVASTLVWFLMVSSAFLAHAATLRTGRRNPPRRRQSFIGPHLLRFLSSTLRRTGKLIAGLNALYIVGVCIFQFSNSFSRCYCNSSVPYWGQRAFDVMSLHGDLKAMRSAWVGGLAMALSTCVIFIGFINLYTDPPSP